MIFLILINLISFGKFYFRIAVEMDIVLSNHPNVVAKKDGFRMIVQCKNVLATENSHKTPKMVFENANVILVFQERTAHIRIVLSTVQEMVIVTMKTALVSVFRDLKAK